MSAWCWPSRRTRTRSSAITTTTQYRERPVPRHRAPCAATPGTRSRNTTSGRATAALKTANFSGGNQQKIVLAREMEQDPGVLIVGQPTRGVDVGAIEFIHQRLIAMRDAGKAVLLVSVELDEITLALRPHPGDVRRPHRRRARPGGRASSELGLLMAGVEHAGGRGMSTPSAKLPRWADYGLIPLINLLVAFLVAGLVVLLVGENPLERCGDPVDGALRLRRGHRLHAVLRHQLHLHRPLRSRSPSIAACSTSAARARPISPASASRSSAWRSTHPARGASLSPLAIAAALLFGALWALIPAYLQAKRGSHIVITTIMFNFIAASLMVYLLVDVLKPPRLDGAADAHLRPGGAHLPKLNWLLGAVRRRRPARRRSTSPVPAGAGHGLPRLGADLAHPARLRDPHHRPQPEGGALCRHLGEARIIIIAMMISGALAGMMALNPIMGDQHRLLLDFVRRRRLRRHRGGADGPLASGRHRAGGDPVRHALPGRRGARLRDAGRSRAT